MKKFIAVLFGLTVLVGLFSSCALSDEGARYAGVCVDPNTQVRLDDSQCAGSGHNEGGINATDAVLMYMLLSSTHSYPAVGTPIQRNYFTTHIAKSDGYTMGIPKTGATSMKTYSKHAYGSGYKAPTSKSYNYGGTKMKTSSGGFKFGGSSGTKSYTGYKSSTSYGSRR